MPSCVFLGGSTTTLHLSLSTLSKKKGQTHNVRPAKKAVQQKRDKTDFFSDSFSSSAVLTRGHNEGSLALLFNKKPDGEEASPSVGRLRWLPSCSGNGARRTETRHRGKRKGGGRKAAPALSRPFLWIPLLQGERGDFRCMRGRPFVVSDFGESSLREGGTWLQFKMVCPQASESRQISLPLPPFPFLG